MKKLILGLVCIFVMMGCDNYNKGRWVVEGDIYCYPDSMTSTEGMIRDFNSKTDNKYRIIRIDKRVNFIFVETK